MFSEIFDLLVLFAAGIILLFLLLVGLDFAIKRSNKAERAKAEKLLSDEPGIDDPRG
jgi:cbb3-type cytochrome oxidase subunit 3